MPGKFSQKREALKYRQHFAARWAQFLHANFDSPEEAAAFFGVDGTTSQRWWSGLHRPTGDVVAYAYEKKPVQAAEALRG